jgi:hypothetical protein
MVSRGSRSRRWWCWGRCWVRTGYGRVDRLDGDGVGAGMGEVLDAPHAGCAAEVGHRADAAAVGEHVVGELGLRRLVVGRPVTPTMSVRQ